MKNSTLLNNNNNNEFFVATFRELYYHPFHLVVNLLFILIIGYFLNKIHKKRNPKKKKKNPLTTTNLPDEVVEKRLKQWKPKPLLPEKSEFEKKKIKIIQRKQKMLINSSSSGRLIKINNLNNNNNNNKDIINFGSCDFLGFSNNKLIKEKCCSTIKKYGVGSCGPRGFYGTIDVHLEMEDKISRFFNSEGCISYSFGYCTISSVIPAFVSRGDIVVCDEKINYAIQTGVSLSRGQVTFFKHNDMKDLERILKKDFENSKGKQLKKRKFVIVEGLYPNVGDITPLKKVIQLCLKYKFVSILEDSFGFGVLGKSGKGTPQYSGVDINDIDIYVSSLEYAFGSCGGFAIGNRNIVEHQRLSGLGYCFSASSPPYIDTAVIQSIDLLQKNEKNEKNQNSENLILKNLTQNIDFMTKQINDNFKNNSNFKDKLIINSFVNSPIINISFADNPLNSYDDEYLTLEEMALDLLKKGFAVSVPQYVKDEFFKQKPSIRLFVTIHHTKNDIIQVVDALKIAFQKKLQQN